MRNPRSLASLFCAATAIAVVSGCGTTVPQTTVLTTGAVVSGQPGAVGNDGSGDATVADGLGPAGSGGTAAATGTTGVGTAAGATTGATVASGTSGTAGTPGTPGVAAGATVPGPAPGTQTRRTTTGTTAKSAAPKASGRASAAATTPGKATAAAAAATAPIIIGYTTDHDLSSATTALGISGADPGDVDGELAAVAKTINSQGGIDGRMITLYDYDFKAADYEANPSSADQAACTAFVQDEHAGVVLDTAGFGSYGMVACLGQAGVPVLTESYGEAGDDDADYAGNLFGPSLMSTDKYVPLIVSHLKAANFFTGWNTATGAAGPAPVKVGILHFDTPELDHYADLIVSQLATIGIKVDPSDNISYTSNIASESSATSAAVLQFAADGVTHVFNANVIFYEAAQSQGYKPRYEIDDLIATPQVLTQNVGAGQLHGSMGAGYWPEDEVNSPPDPSAATGACKAIMTAAGEVPKDQFQLRTMLTACDDLNLTAKLAALGGGTTVADFEKATAALGNGFVPAMTYNAAFTATGHAGAQTVKTFVYTDSCSCFTFNGQ